MPCITLTTDFGTRDWFVGTMKGVVLGLAGDVQLVDLTHEIPPGDLRAGAFALAASYAFFPRRTIHVAVVDPGVGTQRRALAVETADYFFVGPDNGVLSWALAREKIKKICSLENPRYFLPQVSATFHGRDVFAPAAAHLSRGVDLGKLGTPRRDFIRLAWPEPKQNKARIVGEVLYIDRFGNAITNIPARALRAWDQCAVFSGGKQICRVQPSYQSVDAGELVSVCGSSGYVEIAVNGGNAAQRLRLQPGTSVTVRGSRTELESQTGRVERKHTGG